VSHATLVVLEFIECINRGDIEGLSRLMSEDHELRVFDEVPLRGGVANVDAWRGYASSFPSYTIYVHRIVEHGDRIAVLGSTTGSHLGLADDEERAQTLIWVASVRGGALHAWQLLPDTDEHRRDLGLEATA
jgi:ketosteroid isomerase-like protein